MSTKSTTDEAGIYQRPVELLQKLIRFDTSNPPGNEKECISYMDGLLSAAGIKSSILASDPARPNLVARLPGRGSAPPLLMYGHVDVVPVENQEWQQPPFEGKIIDGYVWGRGALDMKGAVSMMLANFLRAKIEDLPLPGDLVLAIVSDEEAGGNLGSRYLVENHPELFKGIRYAIGEIGGVPIHFGKRRCYPMMVAEKQPAMIKATLRGPSAHGSLPMRDSAIAKVGDLLQKLNKHRLPVHITPIVRQQINIMASILPFPLNTVMRLLLNPRMSDMLLAGLGPNAQMFDALLHNTVNATAVHGGEQIWGIPGEVTVELVTSILPGFSPDDLIAELRKIIGEEAELEVYNYEAGKAEPDMSLYNLLADILREGDPGGVPCPLMGPSPSDARHFAQLGIQTYGFTPMNLPADFDFIPTIHAANERTTVEGINFGTEAIYKLLQRFGGK